LLWCLAGWSVPAQGSPYAGQLIHLRQPDGTEVRVRVWGDEFYHVMESLDGYTLVRDPDTALICYARLSRDGNDLVSTGVPAGAGPCEELVLHRHVRIAPDAARARIEESRERRTDRRAGDSGAVVHGGAWVPTCTGNVTGIVILMDFEDEPGIIPPEDIASFFNQPDGYTGYGNNGSVREYFSDVSYNRLDYTNYVTDYYYRSQRPKSELVTLPSSIYTDRELVIEALTDLESRGFDFSEYDSNGDGFVDVVNVLFAGDPAPGSVLHHHSWNVSFSADGVSTYKYQLSSIRDSPYLAVVVHENGHALCGFPDLYDKSEIDPSRGLGFHCMMSAPVSPTNPQHPCAYVKYLGGWIDPIILTIPQTDLTLPATGEVVYKYDHPTAANEYFLIENRIRRDRNALLPDSGLALWHVDTEGWNSWPQMTPEQHFEVTLVQADGQWDLENANNSGDGTDYWAAPEYTECSPDTEPNTNWWDGSASGLVIRDISTSSPNMTFSFGSDTDCNNNGVLDEDDITGGTSVDCNGNWIPDECDGIVGDAPLAEPEGVARSRYISFTPGNAGERVALRVTLVQVEGFDTFETQTRWVGPPHAYPEEDSSDPTRTFIGANLACTPHFQDWGTIDLLRVYGGEIIPGSLYEIEAFPETCAGAAIAAAGVPAFLSVATGTWGDVTAPYDTPGGAPQPDFYDIAGVVEKFSAFPTAPIKASAQLQPNVVFPERPIDFRDIAAGVGAFVGDAYSVVPGMSGPCTCPSLVTCGATLCSGDLDCVDGFCVEGFCTDACARCTPPVGH